jgi:hypothetical protein
MAAKRCPQCGSTNPRYFTHCVECGAKLGSDIQKPAKIVTRGKILIIPVLVLILIVFVVLPAFHYSVNFGRNLSEIISAKPVETPQTQYVLNEQVANNNLRISITSARDGQNTYNSNKFFLVSVAMKNIRESGNIQVSGSDFELIDSEGTRYYPQSMGSKVLYDLSPSQDASAELTFVIPQKVTAEKILFTFQGPSALSSNRHIVTFVI